MIDTIQLYDLIQQAVKDELPVEELVSKLNETCDPASLEDRNELCDSIADALALSDIENNICDKDLKSRERLLGIIKTLNVAQLLPLDIAQERLDVETIGQVNLVPDKKQFSTSYVRLRTKLYFTQTKFNLLREQNSGYAKLITELFRLDLTNSEEVLSNVVQIIGHYRVDPNRVLDLILDIFQHNAIGGDPDIFIEFINSFYDDKAKVLDLLQLKLSFYASKNNELFHIPQTFYRMLAIFIHKRIFELDDFQAFLYPDDAKVLEYHKKLVGEAKLLSRKYAMAVVGDEKPTKSVIETLKETSPVDYHYLEVDNHKVNLCAHLIDLGDWQQAMELARSLPEYHCLSNQRVARSTCTLLNHLIDPIYRECALPKPLNSRIKPTCLFDTTKVPQITTIQDLDLEVFPIVLALGPFLSHDVLTLTKMIRVLKYVLLYKTDEESAVDALTAENALYLRILDVISCSILPSISLTCANSSLAREAWQLIKNFKPHIRYRLYYDWRDEGSNPIALRNKGQILLKAKHHMKRLSKESLRQCARHIGKMCYSNPVITLNYILIQIQSYDNLITMVVDALRFLPPIALDSMIYCIIEALSDPHKNKKSNDGLALAQWLTNLSTFASSVIFRYKVEFTTYLEYISNQLRVGNSLDLVLLADLIEKMTGIEAIQAITDDRIEALMGGDVLRTEGAYFNQVKNTRKSSARLREALIVSRLAMPLCIYMAQLRDRLFFNLHDTTTPLKLVGKLYDQCQETFVQYGVFLSMNLSIDDYINFLPPLEKLMIEHKLDPDTAFFLARPMIFHRIRSKFQELKIVAEKECSVEEGETPDLSPQTKGIKFVEAARYVLDPLAETIQPLLAEKYTSCNLNPKLFVIFWTLSMSDIDVPLRSYEREITRLSQVANEIQGEEDQKKRKERDRCAILVEKLKQELSEQQEHTKYMRMYLESEKNNLFCDNSTYDNVYLESRQFVQHCPFARCIQTACDAVYSARFMLFLHELKVENYPTIICLDRLLCDLTYMMGACTENEATHYGRFLCNILKATSYWHSSPQVYEEHCANHPGSIINDNLEYITYEPYRDICYKWHYRLTRSFSVALESNNYIQIRNALIVMISIIDYYPSIKHFSKGIGIKIDDVRANEKDNRQDLFALATAYAGRLDEIRPRMTPESNFHIVQDSRAAHQKDKKDSSSGSSSRKKPRHN